MLGRQLGRLNWPTPVVSVVSSIRDRGSLAPDPSPVVQLGGTVPHPDVTLSSASNFISSLWDLGQIIMIHTALPGF